MIEATWASDVAAGDKFFECVGNKKRWGNVFKRLYIGDMFIVAQKSTLQVSAIGEVASAPRTKESNRDLLYSLVLPKRRADLDAYLKDAATFDFVQFRKVYRPPQPITAREMLRRIGVKAPAHWRGVVHFNTDDDLHSRLSELIRAWPSHDNQM